MGTTSTLIQTLKRQDWRIWLGTVVTVLWLAGGIWYVILVSSDTPDQKFSLEAVGGFLEGAFAPLAFLWLVLGLFIQQRELANNTEALRLTSEQSIKQTQAIAATEMNARQETFFKISENVNRQLGGISGMLLASGLGPLGNGSFSREQIDDYFAQVAKGDDEVFARLFLSMHFMAEGGLPELMYGTEIRKRHTANYMRAFEKLCKLAKNCDVDRIIEDSLMQSALGLLYQRMLENKPLGLEADFTESAADQIS